MLVDDAFMVVVVVLSLESRRLFAMTTTRFYFMSRTILCRGRDPNFCFFFLFLLLRLGFRVYFFFFKKSFYEGGEAP